jgi:glycosyltransferase involved in cell wall biosynthesis/FMN phosphatase YigB (HAD superfamily)
LELPERLKSPPDRHLVSDAQLEKFFDRRWYYDQTPALHPFQGDVIDHFFRFGAFEDRWPHPKFDTRFYKTYHMFPPNERLNPLVHFVLFGIKRGLQPNPINDVPAHWRLAAEQDASFFSPRFRLQHLQDLADDAAFALPRAEPGRRDQLPARLSEGHVLSLDIWDTLVRRDCHPDEVKLRTVRYLCCKYQDRLRPIYRSLGACYRKRIECEGRADPQGDFEFALEDAFALWLTDVFLPAYAGWEAVRDIAAELERIEVAFEKTTLRGDPAARAFLADHRSVRKIFVSDFYMSERRLRELLAAAGVDPERFVFGFVSCEERANKRDGGLYSRVLKRLELGPDEVVHIGDNYHADVERAREAGLNAHHFQVGTEERRKAWFAEALRPYLRGDAELHRKRLAALAEELARAHEGADHQNRDVAALGCRVAPVFVVYMLWVMQEAVRTGRHQVWFFTREGTFFKRVYDQLADQRPLGLDPPESRLLAVSRRATFMASLRDVTADELMRMWSLYTQQTVKGLTASLSLDEEVVQTCCERLGIGYTDQIWQPWKSPQIQALFADPEFMAHARARHQECRDNLLAYFQQEGFMQDRSKRYAIVDIGWRGTIQDNISRVTGCASDGYYLGLFWFINQQDQGVEKQGFLVDENRGSEDLGTPEVAPIEFMTNTLGGSVTGYRRDGDRVVPEVQTHGPEERSIEAFSQPLQDAIVQAAPKVLDYIDRHGLAADDLRVLARGLTRAVLCDPPAALAEAFFRLEHNETFGTGEIDALGGSESLDQQLEGIAELKNPSEVHATLDRMLRQVRWPEGFLRRPAVADWMQRSDTPIRHAPRRYAEAHLMPAAPKAARIGFVCPSPIRGSGGHRTIFNVARRLIDLGYDVHVLLPGPDDDAEIVRDFLQTSAWHCHQGWSVDVVFDAMFATTPQSAHAIQAHYRYVQHTFYLVQDYEPLFNPMSDTFLLGEDSYALGLIPLTIGNWLSHTLDRWYGVTGYPSGLGYDPSIYYPRADIPRERAIAFVFQPEKPRRAPEMALTALSRVKQALPDTKVYVFGSPACPDVDFDFEHLGLVEDLHRLAELYSRCGVGLAPSLSNPSRVPVEMMACGCVPVDVYRYNNLFDYPDGTVSLAYQDPESLAKAIIALLSDPDELAARRDQSRKFVATRTLDWEIDAIINTVLGTLAGMDMSSERPAPLYTTSPMVAYSDAYPGRLRFCERQGELAGVGLESGRE